MDNFFKDMFVELEEMEYEGHPPHHVLEEYIRRGNLKDGWRFADGQFIEDFMKGRLDDWKLSEVSLHVATCPRCAAKVAQMRAEELTRAEREPLWKRLCKSKERIVAWDIDRRAAYYLPLAYVTAGLLILLVNIFLNRPSSPQDTDPLLLLHYSSGDGPIPY